MNILEVLTDPSLSFVKDRDNIILSTRHQQISVGWTSINPECTVYHSIIMVAVKI